MLTKQHHHHVQKLHFLKNKLNDLYIHLVIQALAISMVSIFVPIYLIELGFQLKTVILFLFMEYAVFGLLAPLCGHIIMKIGIKFVIMIRTPLLVLALFLLALMKTNPVLQGYFLGIAILLGFSGILYTLSITSLFVEIIDKEKIGTETGMFFSLPHLGTIIGPVIGALISIKFGFPVLFFIVSLVLLLSIIPLIQIKKKIDHPFFSFELLFRQFSMYKNKIFSLNLYGIKGFVYYLVLPIAIYLNKRNILTLGFISSIISLLNLIVALIIGRNIDRHSSLSMFRIGSVLLTLYFALLGIISDTPWFIYASLLSGLLIIFQDLPYETNLYSRARQDKSPVPSLVFKEMSLFAGRAVLFIFLLIFAEKFYLGFYLGAVSSLILGFIPI